MQKLFQFFPKRWKKTVTLIALFLFLLLMLNIVHNGKRYLKEQTVEELQEMVSNPKEIKTIKLASEENHIKSNIATQTPIQPKSDVSEEIKPKTKSKKLILFYTNLWGKRRWPGFETTHDFNNWGGYPCKVQNCELTYDRETAPTADVILFHAFGGDMVSQQELKLLSKMRRRHQVWIYFVHASPFFAVPNPVFFNRFFNWTMTYQNNSDIAVPYNWESGTWQKKMKQNGNLKSVNYAAGKDKLMYVSLNFCGLLRDKFIKKLQNYLDIDIYGYCSSYFHKKRKQCGNNKKECEKVKKRYKFVLATEDTFCKDFITSVFYETILDGHAVPVVLGGADYKRNANPNSYIDALDFETIEDLANHLKYLDQNDNAYNSYQKWRENYVLGPPRSWSCEICRMINKERILEKSYDNLGDWYSIQRNCGTRVSTFKGLLKTSNVTGPYKDRYIS